MKIENYDNRTPDVEKLYAEGHSYLFVIGVLDGYKGQQNNRPERPESPILQPRPLPGGKIQLWGDTYHIRDHLKRLGGRWHGESKSWAFTPEAFEKLKLDHELNNGFDLWSGVPDFPANIKEEAMSKWKADIDEYGKGYAFGQEEVGRKLLGRAF
jgi:hypothetical protein